MDLPIAEGPYDKKTLNLQRSFKHEISELAKMQAARFTVNSSESRNSYFLLLDKLGEFLEFKITYKEENSKKGRNFST